MAGEGRTRLCVAALMGALVASACGGPVVPPPPGGRDPIAGPRTIGQSDGTAGTAGADAVGGPGGTGGVAGTGSDGGSTVSPTGGIDFGYRAKCEVIEEPNGPRGGPNPYYIQQRYEVVPAAPGQAVSVRKCGRYGQVVSKPYQLPDDDCDIEEIDAAGDEVRVPCYEVKDNTLVPDVIRPGIEELGWASIHIKASPPPDPVVCDQAVETDGRTADVESEYREFHSIPWNLGDRVSAMSCGCFRDNGSQRVGSERCAVVTYTNTADFETDAYELSCLELTTYTDGTFLEYACAAVYYRVIPNVDGPLED